jgi:peptidoglycan/xylan/chitin deacetylase (PgdA/CDA1 family)
MKKKVVVKIAVAVFLLTLLVFVLPSFIVKPKIILNGTTSMTISMNKKYSDPGYKANMDGKDVSDKVKVKGNVDTDKPGTYEITYTIEVNNKEKKIKRKIKVIDDIKPEITLTNGNDVKICPNTEYAELGYQAIDNYDGDITKKVIIKRQKDKIIYKVKDSSNNENIVTRNIKQIDDQKPEIILQGDTNVTLYEGSKYNEKGYTVSDNCSKDLSSKVVIDNKVNVNKAGTYNISYTVTDESGNTNVVNRTVKVIKIVKVEGSTIYLTFDDGPSTEITPMILDILKEENVKATFFVLNKGDSTNYLLQRIVNEGHTIALHGSSHDYYSVYSSVDAYINDITGIRNKVKDVTGVDTRIMRFVGGSSNTVSKFNPGIMTVLTKEMTDRGYRYYDWNVSSQDTGDISSDAVYNNVIKGLGTKATYIVLMHDYAGNYKTADALRRIIEYGKTHGYSFSTITESTPQVKHTVNN